VKHNLLILLAGALALTAASSTASAADISGNWKGAAETPNGTIERTFAFKVDGHKLTGETTSSMMGKSTIADGKVDGDTVTFTITGNAGAPGATLSYTDGTAKTATASGTGAYSFTVSYNWTGAVTPSLAGYSFGPASTSYSNVLASQSAQNYTATAVTFTR